MNAAPFKRCYCTARQGLLAATLVLIVATGLTTAQSSNRTKSKGPRAVAVLEFDSKQQAHLVPVTIMLNGDFYDASAYKAAPVPMALEPQTVYEGVRSGVSQGLFTITMAHQVLGNWVGEGKWVPTDLKPPSPKKTESKPTSDDDLDKPPVLRRPGSAKSSTPPPAPPPAQPAPPSDDSHTITIQSRTDKPDKKPAQPFDESDRPVLRRGKVEQTADASAMENTKAWTVVSTVPAVSDAKEVSTRSYHYLLRPEELQDMKEKVQALVSKQLQGKGTATPTPASRKTKSAKANVTEQFQNVKFDTYDPSTTNEPIYVYEADSQVTDKVSGKQLLAHIMFVVRVDIYDEMHVLFSSISDPEHMDSQPRCEFIDVVDAEGDGYGDLLFRRTYDSGRTFAIYRVIGNRLYPLFEGKP